MTCGHKSEMNMFGYRQEPTYSRGQRTEKINCGQVGEDFRCQANEFGFCS